jgi:hypothetical protein
MCHILLKSISGSQSFDICRSRLSAAHQLAPHFTLFFNVTCKRRHTYERDLIRYMEQLIRDMDAKIRKNKERAEAESRPKVLKLDDQRRLDEIKMRQAGAYPSPCALEACMLEPCMLQQLACWKLRRDMISCLLRNSCIVRMRRAVAASFQLRVMTAVFLQH